MVNDTHGHVTGDEVLKEIGKRLLSSVRSYDFVGRYGGEQFLVILNNCDPDSAVPRAEQIRANFANRPVLTTRDALPITMSFGVLLNQEWGARPMEELLRETDAALYEAKASGRNCVRLAKFRRAADHGDEMDTEAESRAAVLSKIH